MHLWKREALKNLDEKLEQGVIKPSYSQVASSVIYRLILFSPTASGSKHKTAFLLFCFVWKGSFSSALCLWDYVIALESFKGQCRWFWMES